VTFYFSVRDRFVFVRMFLCEKLVCPLMYSVLHNTKSFKWAFCSAQLLVAFIDIL
jgi:hypothetical protein